MTNRLTVYDKTKSMSNRTFIVQDNTVWLDIGMPIVYDPERYKIEGHYNWKNGDKVVENVDFKTQSQYQSYDNETWINSYNHTELNYIKRPYRTVAIPIKEVTDKRDGIDILIEVRKMFTEVKDTREPLGDTGCFDRSHGSQTETVAIPIKK